jgi:phage terminase small subunit
MRLQNIRHEKFAQLIASGAIASKAYEEAGFSPNGAAQGAERLAGKPAVAERIEELRVDTERLMAMKRTDYLGELQRRFLTLPPSEPATVRYGEMLARAMGWNEPEKINITAASEIQIRIGGMDVPEQA